MAGAKPRGRLLLVTDAMPPVGADDPSYVLYGETITAIDGVVRNAAGSLAGSALDMATAVRNTVQLLGQSLAEAARMASTYPAQFLNVDDRLGHIAEGYQADLVLLDDALQVRGTWIAGQYEASDEQFAATPAGLDRCPARHHRGGDAAGQQPG